jgi:hypothetical protein
MITFYLLFRLTLNLVWGMILHSDLVKHRWFDVAVSLACIGICNGIFLAFTRTEFR